jgi:hypothetical protein
MMPQENFLERTKDQITPEVIQDLGEILGEPEFKVQHDLQHILPTILLGIVEEGATLRGAQRISHLLKDPHPSVHSPLHPDSLQDGEVVTEQLFGNRFYEISEKVIPVAGLRTKNISKLLSLLAPMSLGVLKELLPENNSTPFTLYRFLRSQKKMNENYTSYEAGENFLPRRQVPISLALIFFFLILGSFFWIITKRQLTVSSIENELKKIERTEAPAMVPIIGLSSVEFYPRTTDFKRDGESDLEDLANHLERNPKLLINIIGTSEETGDSTENLRIAEGRAMLIREELIGRGIEASRIRASVVDKMSGTSQVSIEFLGTTPSQKKD